MKIHKYKIHIEETTLRIPAGASFLHIDVQGGDPYVWVLIDDSQPLITYKLEVVGTGQQIEYSADRYIGSYQLHSMAGNFVGHVFLVIPELVKP